MPRKTTILSEKHPYHICARTNNKEVFPLALPRVWEIMCEELAALAIEKKLIIHSFVLMNNHFHLLATTPLANISEIMHLFMLRTSKIILRESSRINHLYGGPYKWNIINNKNYYFHVYRYIYQNPVRAGLCKKVEDYPYSTVLNSNLKFPISSFISVAMAGLEGELRWLNEAYSDEEKYVIKSGFKRNQFSFKPHPTTRKVPLELVRRTFL